VKNDCAKLNASAAIFPLSAKTGEGFDAWMEWCESLNPHPIPFPQ
jgi:Ni2+-binding GTPase involved in maturation of urease and hydrogenase